MLRPLLASLIALVLIAPTASFAQGIPGQEPLSLSVNPASPRPYETVTVTVNSNLVDLAASTITIYLNGAVIEEGMRSAQVKIGGPGTRNTFRAVASGAEGTYEATLSIIPGDVSLIIEPVATNHPFYQGGMLVPSEGKVRIIALTDLRTSPTARVPANQISYTWKLGSQTLLAESGLGRNVLTATAPTMYRDAVVSVTASNQAKTVSGQASITITPSEPLVRIYRTDPLGGVSFEKALSGTFALTGTEETFRAVPFFFKEKPGIEWTLNGNRSGTSPDLTVRSASGSGTAQLNATALGSEARAQAGVTLRFGESTGIFGR